jgi:CubicO group peptidase (beta-lactamase class C family)
LFQGFSIDETRMPGASLSKWPAAVMISGLVADGIMSYDDRANKFLPWWATDPSDPRSNVTLRHLLSFTSGFTEDGFTICSRVDAAFVQCAEALYKVHADRSAHRHDALRIAHGSTAGLLFHPRHPRSIRSPAQHGRT